MQKYSEFTLGHVLKQKTLLSIQKHAKGKIKHKYNKF